MGHLPYPSPDHRADRGRREEWRGEQADDEPSAAQFLGTCADGMISEALVCFDSYALMEGMGTARPA